MSVLSRFTNDLATFYTEQTVTDYDPIRDAEVETTEFGPAFEDVPVRAEQADAEHVTDVYGEWPTVVYRILVDPLSIGTMEDGTYRIGVSSDDRVEFQGVTGTYSLQPPNLHRADRRLPEYIELEAVRIED